MTASFLATSLPYAQPYGIHIFSVVCQLDVSDTYTYIFAESTLVHRVTDMHTHTHTHTYIYILQSKPENRLYQLLLVKSSSTDGHFSILVITGEIWK